MENNPPHQSLDEVMDAMSESQQLHALEQQFPYLFTGGIEYQIIEQIKPRFL